MIELRHVSPECTGRWKRHGTYWGCDTCLMVYYHADDVAEALMRENSAGELLRELTKDGWDRRG